MNRRAMIVKLQGHADDIVALLLEQRRHDRGVDPARHRNDDARLRRGFIETETNGINDPSRRGVFVHGRRPTLTQLAGKNSSLRAEANRHTGFQVSVAT